jgi:hypothetical protein
MIETDQGHGLHGSIRGDACPTIVSTISSALSESARSLANIAPSDQDADAAAVDPNPLVKDSRTLVSPHRQPSDGQRTEDQLEEGMQFDHQ